MAQIQRTGDLNNNETVVGNLDISGTLTVGGAETRSGDFTLNKATPIITIDASTDTPAQLIIDGATAAAGGTGDALVTLKDNGTAKWSIGNDVSATDELVISKSGALATNPVIQIVNSSLAMTFSGALTMASAKGITSAGGAANLDWSASSGTFATGTGAVSLNGNTTIATAKSLLAAGTAVVDFSSGSGVFKTTTGAVTIGNAAISLTGSTTLSTGKTLTITDDGAGLILGSTVVAATGAEINRTCDVSGRKVNVTTTPISVTEATHESKIITVNMAGGAAVTFTLPVATGTAGVYRFLIGTSQAAGSCIIKVPDAATTMVGSVNILDNDANAQTAYAATGTDDTLTLNGTTTGGLAGDWVEFVDLGTNLWAVKGGLVSPVGAGAVADVFSATV